MQVRPARRFGHNGQLRIAFRQVVPPSGMEQEIQSTLEGVEAVQGENLTLDSEGGAQVKPSKSRYLTTSIAIMLAACSAAPDEDRFRDRHGRGRRRRYERAALSMELRVSSWWAPLVGVFARSRTLATGLGAYGAARSIYSHFLAKGHDVVYPKNMSMMIALGSREKRARN